MSAVLAVRDLRVEIPSAGGTLVPLRDISFEVARGEVLGIVGESGAGKSLTGAALTGLLEPPGRIAAGSVELGGRRIEALSEREMRAIRGRMIGTIFQDPLTALDPLYTIGEQLIETIRTHLPRTRAEARASAIESLRQVELPAPERRLGDYPHQLSGGMRQRVVIALALCADPQVLIADEPTTALDVSIQAQIIDLIRGLCRERGTAVVLITHDMGVIAEIADRVAVMYAGRIVEMGSVDTVIRSPHHPYTRGLMASIPRIGPAHERLAQIDGAMPGLHAVPHGCAFHPRCREAIENCARELPPQVPLGGGFAACWLVESNAGMRDSDG
ncbi:MAG: ABC transporter ATP-binding protein [Betaproteobacteria bacterium]|nr:ABC transporter ATP-binding protein [Betaproteobacteria bacterium]